MNKKAIITNLFWKYMERGGVQFVQLIVQIILARLLTPNDYGIIGLLTVFINIATVFIQSGLGTALVQKIDPSEEDYSSVFYINLFISIVMIVILFFLAPYIAAFYKQNILTKILRLYSLTLFINAIWEVHIAILQRELQFRKLFIANLCSSVISGIIGIIAALKGYGIWSLVIQQIFNSLISTVIIWKLVPWRPRKIFSKSSAKKLFNFGSRLLLSNLIDTLYNNIYPLVIGKFYNSSDLGFYNRGYQIPNVLVNNINGSIQGVMFPVFSESQNDIYRLKQLVRRSITTSCFLVFPMMAGLAAVSKPLTIILLTDKWLPSVPFMQISCIIYALWPIHTTNLQAINAVGRSDVFLKLEIIKKIIGITILFFTIPHGIYVMLWGSVVSGILSTFINSYPNKKLLNYGYFEQLKDILPFLVLSIAMGYLCLFVLKFKINIYMILIIQIIIGISFYSLGSFLFKFEPFYYLIRMYKGIKISRK